MTYRLGFFFLAFLFSVLAATAQQSQIITLGVPHLVKLTDKLPVDLTSERSVIVISNPPGDNNGFSVRGKWEELSKTVHRSFRKIGVDAISYIHISDLFAGPEATEKYKALLDVRQVKNIILVEVLPNKNGLVDYRLTVTPFSADDFIENGQAAWSETHNDLDIIFLKMGRQVLRQELLRSNFLIPESPEFLEDLPLFTSQKYETYPSRLKNLALAVVEFKKISAGDTEDEVIKKEVDAFNLEVDAKNDRLKGLMTQYPFKVKFTTETNIAALYKAGYQYVLLPLSSSSESVKDMLNYPKIKSETHHMTSSFNTQGKLALKKIPVDSYVTKYYIRQTIVKDIHTGKVWDADVSWEKALENYLFNFNLAFPK